MTGRRYTPWTVVIILALVSSPLRAASNTLTKAEKAKAPSFDEKRWTGSQGSFEFNTEYSYVAPRHQTLGDGTQGDITEHNFLVRQLVLRRTLLAFLVHGGLEYEHIGFDAPDTALIPGRLDVLDAFLALDFRWSRKDLLRIQSEPGLYTDFESEVGGSFNAPVAIAYTRVVSRQFQWALGLSLNTLRSMSVLPGGGFRWQINDRWKLKFFMPQPQVEYRAGPNLHLFVGGNFRGNSYRVSRHFGDDRGRPELNGALVDYQEIRIGPGFSWNIKPLIALNFQTGYMMGSEFDFHNNGIVLRSGKSPFVNLVLNVLWKLPGDPEIIPQRNQMRFRDVFKYL